ncbi:hypothetical protein [Vibrio phage VpV262]|uniref:Major capsid protein n=1 Tax=Vibrio phage VpV262 TaxID=2907796 RepID=Q8LT47_9CAUD|nr:hypothetical protein VpV262p57 [Vibrio phage VpV262]AAM28402.1 hypothetical protein [Vibrio phage VpV262]
MSTGNNTSNTQALIVSEIWADEIEDILHEKLLDVNIARVVDFPDGDKLTIPSVGTPVVRSRPEQGDFTFDNLDTGEISIILRDEVYAGNAISKKLRQDSRWISNVGAMLPAEQARAIMERYQTDLLALGNAQFAGQNDPNVINGVPHRFVGTGTDQTMDVTDFSRVNYVMTQSKMPMGGMIGIIDPSVAHHLETITNISNISNNPRWEGIVESGIAPDMQFVRSVYGIDLFVSNLLADANETINAGGDARSTTAGKCNMFMNVSDMGLLPFVVAWKEMPTTKSFIDDYNDDLNTATTARWGNGLVRDENLVCVLANADKVTF